MPAIDPVELRARAADLASRFGAPEALMFDLRRLLQDYADTSLRRRGTPEQPARLFYGTPAPVLRTVINALRKRVAAAPLASFVLLDKLWRSGSREERRLAAELLGLVAARVPDRAWPVVETWLVDLDEADSADSLATHGCAPLMQADPRAGLANARCWLAAESEWVRRFGVMTIAALARDKNFHDPTALTGPLRAVMDDPSPDVRKAVTTALREITSNGAVEAARFLREYALGAAPATRWIIQHSLSHLPPDLRGEIERALKT